MDNKNELKWVELVRIDSSWIDKYLLIHCDHCENKLTTRAYTLRFNGTEENMQGLVEFMADSIKHFVFSEAEIKNWEQKGQEPWRKAATFFGDVNPQKEGKYGELLLFLIVEAILKTPMIAHKIRSLSDPNDQIKGSDGVFFGPYKDKDALLLGEAKVYQDINKAMNKALESVDNFHKPTSSDSEIKAELLVVRENITKDLSQQQLDFLLKVLDTQSIEYQNVNKVHPILIVYDEEKISKIEAICQDKADGERMAYKEFGSLAKEIMPTIVEKIKTNRATLKKVYLDFFFIPISSVDNFRNSLFKAIHNVEYR